MLHRLNSAVCIVNICLLNLNYSISDHCPRETIFTMLYVCKMEKHMRAKSPLNVKNNLNISNSPRINLCTIMTIYLPNL